MPQDLRVFLVIGLPVLLALGGGALSVRARQKRIKIIGLVISMGVFVLMAFLFAVSLYAFVREQGSGFTDLVIVLVAIPLCLALPMALYPLLSLWIRPSLAWIVPAILNISIMVMTHIVTQGARPLTEQVFSGVLLQFGLTILSITATWLACFWKRKKGSR